MDIQFCIDIVIRFKYVNAVTNDLWTALAEVAEGRLDIKEIMDTWTLQMGYPVLQVQPVTASLCQITVSISQVERSGPASYRVRQQRYLTDNRLEGQGANSPYNYRC